MVDRQRSGRTVKRREIRAKRRGTHNRRQVKAQQREIPETKAEKKTRPPTRTAGHHPPFHLAILQPRQRVECSPSLERSDALQVLALEEEANARTGRALAGPGCPNESGRVLRRGGKGVEGVASEDGGFVDEGANEGVGGDDGGAGERWTMGRVGHGGRP